MLSITWIASEQHLHQLRTSPSSWLPRMLVTSKGLPPLLRWQPIRGSFSVST